MSRVWSETMNAIAEESGCDWDFVVDMYNYIWDRYGDVDYVRFTTCVVAQDWSARGYGRFEDVLKKLSEDSGYDYDFLFGLFTDMVYDLGDLGDWDYFVGVTMEHDW